MAKKQTFSNELKGLGIDLSKALKKMMSSKEFQNLEKEIVTGIKSISKSVAESLKAAQKSQETSKIKKRLKRVVITGKAQGEVEAKKAQKTAAKGIRKARLAIKKLSSK